MPGALFHWTPIRMELRISVPERITAQCMLPSEHVMPIFFSGDSSWKGTGSGHCAICAAWLLYQEPEAVLVPITPYLLSI